MPTQTGYPLNAPHPSLKARLKRRKAELQKPEKGKKPKKIETKNEPGGPDTPGEKKKK